MSRTTLDLPDGLKEKRVKSPPLESIEWRTFYSFFFSQNFIGPDLKYFL
jgi:hypothetical protein